MQMDQDLLKTKKGNSEASWFSFVNFIQFHLQMFSSKHKVTDVAWPIGALDAVSLHIFPKKIILRSFCNCLQNTICENKFYMGSNLKGDIYP